jgi:serine/threonine protein kinase
MADLFKATHYLHSKSPAIVHRDIKPENVLVFPHGVKLADFGTANYVDRINKDSVCGTPEYLCPEIITKQGHNHKVDVWCLGVLMYELLSGKTPFVMENRAQTISLEDRFKALTANILVSSDPHTQGFRGNRIPRRVFYIGSSRFDQQVLAKGPRSTNLMC